MITVRHLEKLWKSQTFDRMLRELLEVRAEGGLMLSAGVRGQTAAAAMAVIRLSELNQSATPMAMTLIRHLIAKQDPDGGWGDSATTALVIRALLTDRGHGLSLERGLQQLGDIQHNSGAFPQAMVRRLQADADVTAAVCFQLIAAERASEPVRLLDACDWLEQNADQVSPANRRIVQSIQRRATSMRMARKIATSFENEAPLLALKVA